MQLAVVGPPTGASRLPHEKRARHGGRSSRGRQVELGSQAQPPARPRRCAVSGEALPTPLSTPALDGRGRLIPRPLSPPRQSKSAFAGGHASSRCAAGWRGSRRVALGAGRGLLRGRAASASLTAGRLVLGGGEPDAGNPRRVGDPLREPARSPASGAPWRRAPLFWAPGLPKPPPSPAWGGGGNFLGLPGASQTACSLRGTIHISGEDTRKWTPSRGCCQCEMPEPFAK